MNQESENRKIQSERDRSEYKIIPIENGFLVKTKNGWRARLNVGELLDDVEKWAEEFPIP